ncbi:MAG TPA: hypothetical protein VFO83_10060, partial [Aggregicoccus sp.]|nr:hypothetical protein [Aggregicoccus sp.]
FRDNDAARGWLGARLEEGAREALQRLPPGGTLELGLEATVRLELAGQAAGKLTVQRAEDGTFAVTVRDSLALGLGAGARAGAAAADATALGGLKGGLTLHFASADEAADRLAALAQTSLRAQPLGVGLALLGGLDADGLQRSREALGNVARFEAGLYGQLKGELELEVAKLGFEAARDARLVVDLERGSVAFELSQDVAAVAKAKLPALKAGGLKLSPEAALAQAHTAQQDTLRLEVRLREGELAQLKQGRLDPGSLLRPERLRVTLTQARELDLAGAHVRAQRDFVLSGALPSEAKDPALGSWRVSAGVDGGAGGELGFKTGALDLKAELKTRVPLFESGPLLLPLADVEHAVLSRLQERQRDEALVNAQLALSR